MRKASKPLDMYYVNPPRISHFGDDKCHGPLFISEYGDVLICSEGQLMILDSEMGGYNSKYEVFRWYDAETGVRKKAYISKLLREKFGKI